ncbi:uncharacterized protein [Clinocottus analis]|uniref:uncharacterized protein isoform X2 n=1 Tax=Clinocottus analis TaxID=304258 RepID=UPI0035BF603D
MSLLLREIKQVDIPAALVLEKAGVFTDSEILALTRDDLRDLFPKHEDFQRRRTLFDTIHKQPIAERLLQNLKGFIPHDFLSAALTKDGVLVDYFQHLKDMKTQMNGQMSFINAHINLLEEFREDQPDSRQTDHSQEGGGAGSSYGDEPMELQDSSTSNDAQRAPGSETSNVHHHKKHHAGSTGGSSPKSDEPFIHLSLLDLEKQLYSGQKASTSDDQVGLHGSLQRAQSSGASYGYDPMEHQAGLTSGYPQGASGQSPSVIGDPVASSKRTRGSEASGFDNQRKHRAGSTGGSSPGTDAKVLYKMVVSGKTFGNHMKLMTNVEEQVSNRMQLCGDNQDYELTFVYCPISSRIGTDVEWALAKIKDKKPIILVLMHHMYEVKAVTSMKTWPDDANVVLRVNVFYHETMGLLTCEENDAAVTEIKNKLLAHFIKGSNDTSENAQAGAGVLAKMNKFGSSIAKHFPRVTGS